MNSNKTKNLVKPSDFLSSAKAGQTNIEADIKTQHKTTRDTLDPFLARFILVETIKQIIANDILEKAEPYCELPLVDKEDDRETASQKQMEYARDHSSYTPLASEDLRLLAVYFDIQLESKDEESIKNEVKERFEQLVNQTQFDSLFESLIMKEQPLLPANTIFLDELVCIQGQAREDHVSAVRGSQREAIRNSTAIGLGDYDQDDQGVEIPFDKELIQESLLELLWVFGHKDIKNGIKIINPNKTIDLTNFWDNEEIHTIVNLKEDSEWDYS